MWGTAWTPAEVNAATFGVALRVTNASIGNFPATATVNYVRVTITYTAPIAMTVDAVGVNKTYDGTTDATVTLSSHDLVPGDNVTFDYSAAFADKNVGTAIDISVEDISLGGPDAGKYTLQNTTATTAADITAAELTVDGVTVADKAYDGTTDADADFDGAELVGVITGDEVTLDADAATAVFADKNVGTGKAVAVSGFALSGADAGNYALTQPEPTADITAAELTVDGVTVADKAYDGTTDTDADFDGAELVGVITGDEVTLDVDAATAVFADKNVGTGKAVAVSGFALSGADAGNYELTQPEPTADITAAALTVDGVTVADKAYDGTTDADADFDGAELVGVITGDEVTLDADAATAVFADKNVGTGKAVAVSGFALSGDDAGNYELTQPEPTADITAAALTVSAAGIDKVYDGTTAAEVDLSISSGAVLGDDVAFDYTAAFADKNVGTGIEITVEGISLAGADAGNYDLQNTEAVTEADITAAALTVTAKDLTKQVGQEFVFDGSEFTVAGLMDGDEVTAVTFTCDGAAAAALVGSYPIVVSDAEGTGLDNYDVAYVDGTMTVSKAPAKVYKVGAFAKPLRKADARRFKRGTTVRVAFKVKDANGKLFTKAVPKLKVTRSNKTVLSAKTVKYNKAKKQYVYNLKLKKAWKTGWYNVRVGLGAGNQGRVVAIRLVK